MRAAASLTLRDLHACGPDDYAPGEHDILATDAAGAVFYSPETFASRDSAEIELAGLELSGAAAVDGWPSLGCAGRHSGGLTP